MSRRRRTDEGTALVEFVWLAILMLVPLVYVVLAVFETQRTAYAASAAARSATRAFLTAPDEGSARARAATAAELAFADQGRGGAPYSISWRCRPDPANCLSPGSVVTATVVSRSDLPLFPALLGGQAPTIRIESQHAAPYGKFREDR